MNVILYSTIEGYDDGDFDARDDYYKSDDDYFDAVQRENEMNSNVAFDVISNLGNVSNRKTVNFNQRVMKSNAKEYNYKAESVSLINEDDVDENVDSFITNCITDDVVVYTIKLNPDNIDPEFEEDYLNWIGEHNNINRYVHLLGDDKVWEGEPVRDFKVEFINKAGETKYAQFNNCKIIENNRADIYSCTILVEKVTLIEKI